MLDMSVTFVWEVSFLEAARDALAETEAEAEAVVEAVTDAEELLLWCSLSAIVETEELRSNLLASKSLRKLPVDCMPAEAVVAKSGDS